MADTKISDLTAITTPALTDLYVAVQSGVDYKVTGTQVRELVLPNEVSAANGSDVNITNATTWYDIVSVALTTGKWLVSAQTNMSAVNNCWFVVAIAQGSGRTIIKTNGKYSGTAALQETMGLPSVEVTISGSESVYLQGWTDNSSGSPRAVAKYRDGYTLGVSTYITAIKCAS